MSQNGATPAAPAASGPRLGAMMGYDRYPQLQRSAPQPHDEVTSYGSGRPPMRGAERTAAQQTAHDQVAGYDSPPPMRTASGAARAAAQYSSGTVPYSRGAVSGGRGAVSYGLVQPTMSGSRPAHPTGSMMRACPPPSDDEVSSLGRQMRNIKISRSGEAFLVEELNKLYEYIDKFHELEATGIVPESESRSLSDWAGSALRQPSQVYNKVMYYLSHCEGPVLEIVEIMKERKKCAAVSNCTPAGIILYILLTSNYSCVFNAVGKVEDLKGTVNNWLIMNECTPIGRAFRDPILHFFKMEAAKQTLIALGRIFIDHNIMTDVEVMEYLDNQRLARA
jgi:hypothetical protein